MGVGLVVGQELPFTPRGPPVICLLKGAGVAGGGGGTAPPRHSRWGAQGPLRGGLKALGWRRTQWSHSHQWGSQQGLRGAALSS